MMTLHTCHIVKLISRSSSFLFGGRRFIKMMVLFFCTEPYLNHEFIVWKINLKQLPYTYLLYKRYTLFWPSPKFPKVKKNLKEYVHLPHILGTWITTTWWVSKCVIFNLFLSWKKRFHMRTHFMKNEPTLLRNNHHHHHPTPKYMCMFLYPLNLNRNNTTIQSSHINVIT